MGGMSQNLVRQCGCERERSVWQYIRFALQDADNYRTLQAIRQAQDLGFHCEPGPLHTGELLEQRVRAWLSCIVTDQWWVRCGVGKANIKSNRCNLVDSAGTRSALEGRP
jgi:hypothetical protein